MKWGRQGWGAGLFLHAPFFHGCLLDQQSGLDASDSHAALKSADECVQNGNQLTQLCGVGAHLCMMSSVPHWVQYATLKLFLHPIWGNRCLALRVATIIQA